ncbi:MAG: carbamoyltransferase [Candidatus Coatesbacteria bacterium]|nr:carbamoyltransferase [Candidatus Coatesbacteria bacterium]
MKVLGISMHYHDSAACLYDGESIFAACEERFTRKKHDPRLPVNAVGFCLRERGIIGEQLDWVAYHERPLRRFKRIISDGYRTFPRSYGLFRKAIPVWLGQKRAPESLLSAELCTDLPSIFVGHHLSHAASAYFASPFEEAAILTADAVGEALTTSWGLGTGSRIELKGGIEFPHSLGMFYSALTHLLGFEVMEGEGKIMGLAAYGEPRFDKEVRELIRVNEDGSFALNMKYFCFDRSLKMSTPALERLLFPARSPEEPIEEKHKDLAASLQKTLEEILLRICRQIRKETNRENICIAGGIGLNSCSNGRILREGPFENIFVQPAAGDAGCSLGAALYASCQLLGVKRPMPMSSDRLGPSFKCDAIARFLDVRKVAYRKLDGDDLVDSVARLIADGKIVGWFQGRMEFGPRALGGRSILANPLLPDIKSRVNSKVKFREAFRPFGASVPEEDVHRYFACDRPSPFMMFVVDVRPEHHRSLSGITHVDGTCRIQTVSREYDERYHAILRRFGELTGYPVVLNTSFNIKGDPIVCSPNDALECFLKTGIDALVMEDLLLEKER